MKLLDLSGKWKVTINNANNYNVVLPGTLDENKIGDKSGTLITTRLTRAFTYEGKAVYSKRVILDKNQFGKRVFFEAERSRDLSLMVNDIEIAPYREGTLSTPYIFEITDQLRKNNLIKVTCDNSYLRWSAGTIKYSSAATDETQTNWNGILGYLRLRYEAVVFVSNIQVLPHGSSITVKVEIDAKFSYTGVLSITCEAMNEEIHEQISLEAGYHTILFEDIPIDVNCKHWDEYEGNRYELIVSGTEIDKKSVSFGIRDFGKNDAGRLTLNGRVVFLRCDTNCCVFPETGYMPLSETEWIRILEMYKSYGVNCVRFHSHCPPTAAFLAADRLGIMIQPELSHWNPETAFEDENSRSYYKTELINILQTYANHPSFVMLSLGNELQANDLGHARMTELLDLARSIDDTRMYANGSNVHYGMAGTDSHSDFYTSVGFYHKMLRGTSSPMIGHINESYPNAQTDYNTAMEELRREYSGPVFSFEVGQYEVLPDFDQIEDFHGITIPNNLIYTQNQVMKRGIYFDWKRRVEATGELALLAYREEVEAALRTKDLSGISLLSLQDFPGQGTALIGMMDSHLKPKPYRFAQPDRFREFFREVLPMVLLSKYTYTNQELLSARIEVANYGREQIVAPTFYTLNVGSYVLFHGELPPCSIPCGGLTVIGTISISLQSVTSAQRLTLTVSTGKHRNEYPIWVYPEVDNVTSSEVVIAQSFIELKRETLKGKKVLYAPVSDLEHFPSSIKSQFTTNFWSVGAFADQSGCMGCLIEASHPIFSCFPTEMHSNWQWWSMSKGQAFLLPEDIEPIITAMDSISRLRRLAYLFECNVGEGKLIVSSLGLLENQHYPEGRALLHSILNYMCSKDFMPRQSITIEKLQDVLGIQEKDN